MKNLKAQKQPNFVKPELAVLTEKYFSDKDWIYEEKLDGIRCIAIKKNGVVHLFTRNRNSLNATYPEIVKAVHKQRPKNFILDGEIVAFEKKVTSFSKLQQIKKQKIPVYYYVFDLLYFNKYDLKDQKLIDRKKMLKSKFQFSTKIRLTRHIKKEGEKYFRKACRKGWEGIMAKKADSKYKSKRTHDWRKFKCSNRQEFIIIGYTNPQRSRIGFGALLIGYYDRGKLKFGGKVGTGYDDKFLKEFSKKLKAIATERQYFSKVKGAHFVRLKYVGEVAFTEWTSDGKLCHPRFLGLRRDKSPRSVVRERSKRRKA